MWSSMGFQPKRGGMVTNCLGLGGTAANLRFRQYHDKCVDA